MQNMSKDRNFKLKMKPDQIWREAANLSQIIMEEEEKIKNDEIKDLDKNQPHKKSMSQDYNLPSKVSAVDSKLLVPGKID